MKSLWYFVVLVLSTLSQCIDCIELVKSADLDHLKLSGYEEICASDCVNTGNITAFFGYPRYIKYYRITGIKVFVMYSAEGNQLYPTNGWKAYCNMNVHYHGNGKVTCYRDKFPCWCFDKDGRSRMKFFPLQYPAFYQIQVQYEGQSIYTRYLQSSNWFHHKQTPEMDQYANLYSTSKAKLDSCH
ncbi:uncharacterized protein LOC131940088 isoform X1 [Physella acuta]|uniref:uncharacterized protein LOC131940088 isoform X1 n=1 Tax=Physella acuta TaxID=109671 RepID=UPI0027DC7268|nr:uncharacterized protein LOC131940088 isoform X1 [Physella acuta]